MKGVAFQDPFDSQIATLERPIPLHCLDEVRRAGRIKPAACREKWRYNFLIPFDEKDKDPFHDRHSLQILFSEICFFYCGFH